jgi:predicted Zn finger-like uncharacterized protein
MEIACPSCAASYQIDADALPEAGRKVRCVSCGTIWRAFRPEMAATEPASQIDSGLLPGANPYATEPPEDIFGEGVPHLRQALESEAAGPVAENIGPASEETEAGLSALAQTESAVESVIEPDPALLSELAAVVAAAPDSTAPIETGTEEAEPPRGARIVKKPAGKTAKPERKSGLRASMLLLAASLMLMVGAVHQREALVKRVPQTAALFQLIGMPVNLRGIEIRNIASRMVDDNGINILVIDGDLINVTRKTVDVPRLRLAVTSDKGEEIYVWTVQSDKPSLGPGESLNFRRRLAAPPQDGQGVRVRFLRRTDTTASLR